MDHYIDIRLRPDPDFAPAMLMGALYNKLHRALFDLQAEDLGVSFLAISTVYALAHWVITFACMARKRVCNS